MVQPNTVRLTNHRLVDQILVAMLQNRPFDTHIHPAASTSTTHQLWSSDSISDVLRSVPRFFFQSARSIGTQKGFRHRTPLKQRKLKEEAYKFRNNVLVLGPAAHRDPFKVKLGLSKALEFFYWVETHFGFQHDEITCREMACVLARGNRLMGLWDFLKEMSRRGNGGLVTTATITCLIKVLGEEGLVNEALTAFYRMKHLQTGCKKAIRRRLWEANHLFRIMLFKGFSPDVVTYNSLIDGCCKTYRIKRALELFEDMSKRGCTPNRLTYNSFIRYYSAVNEIDQAIKMLRMMQKMNHGIATSSSYTPIIHALCEGGKVIEARDFLLELLKEGSVPREYTYQLVCNLLNSAGKASLLDENVHERIRHGIENRYKEVKKVKLIMSRKGY
ncbi:hypothetical protein IC582_021051 [Cucumis melo]